MFFIEHVFISISKRTSIISFNVENVKYRVENSKEEDVNNKEEKNVEDEKE